MQEMHTSAGVNITVHMRGYKSTVSVHTSVTKPFKRLEYSVHGFRHTREWDIKRCMLKAYPK